MNQWILRMFSLCMSAILLLTACQPKAQNLLPVTGAQDAALVAPAALARDNILKYLVASSRLAAVPPVTDWQLVEDDGRQPQREYRFRSGDWLMVIRLADSRHLNQEVILLNEAARASWSGYITPDGRVVDTAYGR